MPSGRKSRSGRQSSVPSRPHSAAASRSDMTPTPSDEHAMSDIEAEATLRNSAFLGVPGTRRYSDRSLTPGYESPTMREKALGASESSGLLSPSDSMFENARPQPSFMRDSMGRPSSYASSHLLSGSTSDYDSVYQLWRQSGTPGSFKDLEEAGGYGKGSRPGTWGGQSTLGRDSPYGLPAAGVAQLTKGEGGARGPKDYRAVGLAKYGPGKDQKKPPKRKWLILLGVAFALGLVLVAVMVPISQTVLKDQSSGNSSSQNGAAATGDKDGDGKEEGKTEVDPKTLVATWGTNGSEIDLGNGQKFTYVNNFGGRWVSQPLNDTAQAQDYTPPLNEEFDYARNRILGVNLGGWLMTEPFISPALYEPYENDSSPALDEFMLSQKYLAEGGQANLRRKMTEHYETFITERDFADIVAAGLNWVRIPIGFWALETFDNEPFLKGVSWDYFLKAIQWARKYGLRINLDLHAVPGSQNGYNHSGRRSNINFLMGPMGYANGQRTLDIIRRLTQFISQPEVRNVVPMFSIINEPRVDSIGRSTAEAWYAEAYEVVRNVTGTGIGNGPYITIHDGFLPLNDWNGFLEGADRVAWDTHPYLCFGPQNNDPWDVQIMKPCQQYAPLTDQARAVMGVTMGGETSLAINDCGLFLNGVGDGARYDGSYSGPNGGNFPRMGSCQQWDDYESYSDETRTGLRRFALTAMDSLHNFFFWTWKIGDSLRTGKPTTPMWSYKLGLEQGWMPRDPLRQSDGACQAQAARIGTGIPSANQWQGWYQGWQTGNASSFSPNLAQYPWPPQNLAGQNLPRYTATKSLEMLPTPTFTQTAIVSGDPHPTPTIGAWYRPSDTRPQYTTIAGCNYPPDQYVLDGWNPSGWPCGGR